MKTKLTVAVFWVGAGLLGIQPGAAQSLDFGDAPDGVSAILYPTLLLNNGARHPVVTGAYLGASVDVEPDGQPTGNADGDDLNPPAGPDDEDGVIFMTPLVAGQTAIIQITTSTAGWLYGWLDFGADNSWSQAEDAILVANAPGAGTFNYPITVPGTASVGPSYARFRFTTDQVPLGYDGLAVNGEVEDYRVEIQAGEEYDCGDAPDSVAALGYPTLLANNGAQHMLGSGLCLGALVDAEADGQPDAQALGDDNNPPTGLDDEDGVSFPTALFSGVQNRVQVVASVPAGVTAYFNMWIDLNGDGNWTNAGEQVVVDNGAFNGTQWYPFTPGAITATNSTFVRCRLSTVQGLTDRGPAFDGEVEDYIIPIAPVKWLQPPDLTSNGVDVSLVEKMLANDFRCTLTGPITDLHIWTSFYQDLLPSEGLNSLAFTLEIYSDVPAGPENLYSHPGELLWARDVPPFSYAADRIAVGAPEWWFDPAQNLWVFPGDTQVFQYDFTFPADVAFVQTKGTIYWLAVRYQDILSQEPAAMGWKSCPIEERWQDDAVWFDPDRQVWVDLHYGNGHEYAQVIENSMDLALAVTGIEGELDFGDAPDSPGIVGYPTLLANNGARHSVVPGVFMGSLVDAESDGQPDATATGDDNNNADDEDGVNFTSPLYMGGSATFDVICSAAGFLSVWIDFNADGDWTDVGENIFATNNVVAGTNTFAFVIPGNAIVGNTFMRFRYTTQQVGLAVTGQAPDGEVEDYEVAIQEEVQLLDFGDAWDSMTALGYPTLLANNGARHAVVPGICLGNSVDLEPNGQPTLNADGDDNNPPMGIDDEDGVIIPPLLIAGSVAQVQVIASVPGFLNAWIDFNANGTWIDPGEQAFFNQPLIPGLNVLPLSIPAYPATMSGGPHSRWRFTTYPPVLVAPMFMGAETDGEVEDYEVRLEVLDFGDAPDPRYPTLLANDGARHRMPSAYYLGIAPDDEPDGQPDAQALGDDNANVDDEDLVVTLAKAVQGETKTIVATASTNGFLNIWIDFDQNGSWDASEQVVADQALVPGTNDVVFATPQAAQLGTTFGRVRFCSYRGLGPTGFATDGEVEDYEVAVFQNGPDPSTFRITNIVYSAPSTATIWWASESNVTYWTQWASNLVSASNVSWTTWGPVVLGPANTQTDTNAAETTRFYRVIAPFAPPPP